VIGIGVGGLVMLLTLKSERIRMGGKLLAIGAVVLLVLVSLLVASRSGGIRVLTSRLSGTSLDIGVRARVGTWFRSAQLAVKSPVLGVGFGNEALALYQGGYRATESHNDLITATATTGIPGLLMYVTFLILWLLELWRMPHGIWRASLLGMWVAFFITAMFNPSLSLKSLWLAAGISAASIVCARTHQESALAAARQTEPAP
jgi:O-antigen ligase